MKDSIVLFIYTVGHIAVTSGNQTITTQPATQMTQTTTQPTPDPCKYAKLKLGCPSTLKINWLNLPPYVYNTTGTGNGTRVIRGHMKKIVELLFRKCCGGCVKFEYPESATTSNELWKTIGHDSSALYFPVYGVPHDLTFQGNPFYSVIEPPGSIYFQAPIDKQHMPKTVMNAVFSGWPVFVLTIVMAAMSGIVIWAFDSFCNPDFPRSFFKGSWNGFWWAFVSMTTVGYGDRVPKSFIAKVFAFFWVLLGLVIIGLFTGSISTALTASCLRSDDDLVGKSIVVFHGTPEEKFGTTSNAVTHPVKDIDSFVAKILSGEVNGGLLDSYGAGYYRDKLTPLRFSKIFEENQYAHGFVTSNLINNIVIPKCLRQKLSKYEEEIDQIILSMDVLKVPPSDAALEKSLKLFDGSSRYFQMAVIICIAASAVLLLAGLSWEYLYYRPKHKGIKPLEENKKTLHPSRTSYLETYATQCRDAENSLIEIVERFYKTFNDKVDDVNPFGKVK